MVSMLAMPPRENRSSICGTPESLTKPVAIAAYPAFTAVATLPRLGSSTNATTASHWRNGASTAANSAEPRIDRNGGIRRTASTTSSTSGSRLRTEMSNAEASAARASSVLTVGVGVGGAARARRRSPG